MVAAAVLMAQQTPAHSTNRIFERKTPQEVALAAAAVTAVGVAQATPNLRACYDGKCKPTLSRPASFRFSITRLRITFNADRVRVVATGPVGREAGAVTSAVWPPAPR